MLPRTLLDTHILLRWLLEARKLTREQIRVLNIALTRGKPMAISAVTLIEIAMLVTGKRVNVPLPEFLQSIEANPILKILPITSAVASEVAFLSALSDPMDRTIVATARIHGLTLATSDQRIIGSGLVKTIN